jgi:predicted nucleic acid-binding protein
MSFMNDKCFVDTNILLYAHDRSSGSKHTVARSLLEGLWDTGTGVLSTQVLQELAINLRRKTKPPLPHDEVRAILVDYLSWEIVVNTSDSVLHALDLEARFGISFWDALILHAAETAGASVLYSEDFSHGRAYGVVRATDPFKK